MRAESILGEVIRMVRQTPFRPFVLNIENGDRISIENPENIAFDSEDGSMDFYVIAGEVRFFSTFESVTSVAAIDSAEPLE